MATDQLPEPFQRVGMMKSRFDARPLPLAIMDGDGKSISGPFCVHCGNPDYLHSRNLGRCPNRPLFTLLPGPSCTCHGYADEVTEERRRIPVQLWKDGELANTVMRMHTVYREKRTGLEFIYISGTGRKYLENGTLVGEYA